MTNTEFRIRVIQNGLFNWQIAKALGVSVPTLTRWLREEPLQHEHEQRIIAAFATLKQDQRKAARA